MFNELIRIYQIGKQLGLTRKEINKSFFFNEETHSLKGRIIFHIILLLLVSIVGIVLIGFMIFPHIEDTYGISGERYSTVKLKDFKKKVR